jgi:hypothetical protein
MKILNLRIGAMAVTAAVVMLAAPAMGGNYYANGSDGNYTNGVGNAGSPWIDDGQPAGSYPDGDDTSRFTNTATYTITVTGNVTSDWIRPESGNVTLSFPAASDILLGKIDSPNAANGTLTVTGLGTNDYRTNGYFNPNSGATVIIDAGNVLCGKAGYSARMNGTLIITNDSYFGAVYGNFPNKGGSTIIVDGANSYYNTGANGDHYFNGSAGQGDHTIIVKNGAKFDHNWFAFPNNANNGGTILVTGSGTEWIGKGGGSHVTFGHSSGNHSVTVTVANAAVMTCGNAPNSQGGVGFENNSTFVLDDASFGFCNNSAYAHMTVFSNATLTGKGLLFEIINATSILFMNGTLAPGLSVGTITAKVNVVNMDAVGCVLEVELDSTSSYDQLIVTDAGASTTVNLDSDTTVEVTPLNPETFTLKVGDTFDLVTADDVDISGGTPTLSFQGPEAANFAGTLTVGTPGSDESLRLTLTAAPSVMGTTVTVK